MEGELELLVEGKPPVKYKAGDSFVVPEGAVHDAKAVGDKPFKVLAVYIVKAGEPVAKPAPLTHRFRWNRRSGSSFEASFPVNRYRSKRS
jgi:oxalate decarboxylase/phosphoglucose isomerase-like protein (cupin superfamily)